MHCTCAHLNQLLLLRAKGSLQIAPGGGEGGPAVRAPSHERGRGLERGLEKAGLQDCDSDSESV